MDTDRPKILFPPPVGFLIALGIATGLNVVLPLIDKDGVQRLPWALLGGGMAVFGLSLGLVAAYVFKRAGTHVDPYKPALIIVRDGPYGFTRNPMYVGLILLLLAAAPGFLNLWVFPLAVCLWAALNWGVVANEEAYLSAKFGAEYDAFLGETRRWL